MRILLATTNPNKLREIRAVLGDAPVSLATLADFPSVTEPDETGETFEENARLKARYYGEQLAPYFVGGGPELVVAEDSGLVVDALGGDPGVRSARFLRPEATYPERFAEIYRRLETAGPGPHAARFVCALAAMRPRPLTLRRASVVFETTGVIEGEITSPPRGRGGFGYDPIFYYPPYGCTLAEVTDAEKVAVAHRGKAFRALAEWLKGVREDQNGEWR